jgi:hypothetical protein
MGATLYAGFHNLVQSPDRFTVELRREAGAGTLTLLARLKDEQASFRVEVGNGVENSWRGYFSLSARQTSIVVDAERLVPFEEQTGEVTVRYADWRGAGEGKSVPQRIDVLGPSSHYRMHFDWTGDSVWLLRRSESITPEATISLTLTRNVLVNDRAVSAAVTDAEKRTREATHVIAAMLDHNRPWLDRGATGTGWQPSFETLSYTFHTIREDIRETAVVDRGGDLLFQIEHDGTGKMKGRVGERQIALRNPEFALTTKGARFARIHGRSSQDRGQPFDVSLKQYARIGCQFDLPLFRYRELLDSIPATVKNGAWEGRPAQIATIMNPGADLYLGCGTMLAFTSWSYVHHIRPSKEVLTIDSARNVPLHATLTSDRDERRFEIDFSDYIELEPGQWAPLAIRIESKDYFTCEYRFQIVRGKHWLLKDVVSWFKPDGKSRGVIDDVRVNANREQLDDALRQVAATKSLFSGALRSEAQVKVAAVPFVLGRAMQLGKCQVLVTMQPDDSVGVAVSTADRNALDTVSVCFLNERGRLLFAPSIKLTEQGRERRGLATIRGSRAWRGVRSIIVPADEANAALKSIGVIPLRWGEPIALNIPGADDGNNSGGRGKEARETLTRVFQVRAERNGDETVKLTLDVVSIDSMSEFYLDVTAALLGPTGDVLASGGVSTELHVESNALEKRFEIALGKIRAGAVPAYLALGVAPGNVVGGPMGSRWGRFMISETAFEIAALLAAPDAGSRRAGLNALVSNRANEYVRFEFLDDRLDQRNVAEKRVSRLRLLEPLAESLARIAREPGPPDVRADAARFLAYSKTTAAAETLRQLLEDSNQSISDAAAIGLTFLGQSDCLERLRSILSRKSAEPRSVPRSRVVRLEEDPLLALVQQHSDAAVDILGTTLVSDIRDLRLVGAGTPQVRLEGRLERAQQICKLLGRTGNPRSVRWLIATADQIAERPELAERFPRHELAMSMLNFSDEAKERIISELERGNGAGDWAYALRNTRSPDYLPAMRTMLRRRDLPDYAKHHAVMYLWNLGTPAAIDAMCDAYDRKIMKGAPTLWLRLCEALASSGDGRGLPDAYAVLVDLARPAEAPLDEQTRRDWEHARDRRKSEAEAVFERASKEILAKFLDRKTEITSPAEQETVLRLLWRLPELPMAFVSIVPTWTNSSDSRVAELAKRLLDRG